MNRVARQLFALLTALAVFAGACSSTTTVSPSETADVADDSGLFDDASGEQPAPATTVEPTATPEPEPVDSADEGGTDDSDAPAASEAVVGERYDGEPVSDFQAPASWRELLPDGENTTQWVLENGTRIIVRPNGAPGSQAQLRLVVGAGSVHEEPDALGAAHYLEHMMFNGTERFPGNELVPVLEGFGAGFGADINAYTSFDETVYKLTVPTADFADIELAIDVLAEWAYRATISPDAVDAERGVIREEYRQRVESASGRLSGVLRRAIFDGTVYAGRDPIGTLDSIETLAADDLRGFYERWYRPDNLTIIAVGDFDPSAVRSAVIARFDGAETNAAPDQPIDAGPSSLSEPVFDVFTDPEITRTDLQVHWRVDGGPVTNRNELRHAYVRALATTVLDVRLFEAVQREQTVLLSASSSAGRLTPRFDIVSLRGQSDPATTAEALGDLLRSAEQLRQHPVTADEFARARERIIAGIEQQFAESGSAQDSRLAEQLIEFALGGDLVMTAEGARDSSLEVLDTIEPIDIQAYMHEALSAEPYVLVSGPDADAAVLPRPEDLSGIFDETIGFAVEAPQIDASTPTELMARPAPADIVDQEYVEPLDAVVYTYANGARLAFRRTTIVENRVEFQAWSRGGFFQEEGPIVPLLGRADSLVLPSGFESLDTIALDQILGSVVANLSGDISRAVDSLSGDASTADMETMFQLAHLQMTESTIDDLQVRRFDEVWRPFAEDPGARPQLAADLLLWSMRYGDSPYFRLIPTIEDLDTLDVDAQLQAFQRRFDNAADFVFVVVGDADAATVGELGARYLGTLPASTDREAAIDRDPGVPEANLVETIAVGIGDQGRLRINWESPYEASIAAEVRAQALEVVVDARLRDLIREQLGASYSPSAAVSVLREPKPWVDTIIEVDGDPDRLDEISATIRDELARIRAGDFDPEYLNLAVNQLAEDYRFYSNPDWIAFITTYLAYEDRPADEHRQRTDIARGLTVADIAATAQVVFPETRSVEVRMVPAG